MNLQSSWAWRGYFDLSAEDPRSNTTQLIRQALCALLGLPGTGLHMASYPVGPAWRRVFWWREGEADYAEAQFFLRIARDHAVLSLGVSVEKGYETDDILPGHPERLDRASWDWPRLVDAAHEILAEDVPAVCMALRSPIILAFRSSWRGETIENDSRAFSWVDGSWFERHRGSAKPVDISSHISALDQHHDRWIDVYFGLDISAAAADLSPRQVAQLLFTFDPIRRRLRGRTKPSGGRTSA